MGDLDSYFTLISEKFLRIPYSKGQLRNLLLYFFHPHQE